LAPESGFAQVRLAEMSLAFDRRREALAALDRAVARSPRLASARALRGFVFLDREDPRAARAAFEEALAVDASLGSAWLGKGLAEMRLRRREEGLRSLETAAALEPRRALHRAYLGKGFSARGEARLAEKEFRLARDLDPADPTAWFYSALHAWQENRPNAALRDLERSVELNGQRQLFRSRLALDRDLAVRQANLAGVYRDAGLPEAGLRSAADAVVDDYANSSGHLFLAHSYQALEDPNRFDLRYETVRQSELLMANLLAPAGGANLSQWVSQQEHLRFFDPPPMGVATFTEYRSPGGWRQLASVFGTLDGFGYALDADLAWAHGPADNDERERRDVSLQVKQRVTGRDEVYFQAAFQDAEAGDVARHEDPDSTRPGFRVEEEQIPNVYLGWHRAWSPESHTLLLVSRLTDSLRLEDPAPEVLFLRQSGGAVASVSTPPLFQLRYESRFTLYSAEWQQVWQHEAHTVVAGVRGQAGEVEPEAVLGRPLTGPVTDQRFDEPLRRVNAYLVEHWQVLERLQLIAGLGYDRLEHPLNSEVAPLTEGTRTRERVGPRAGVLATPWSDGRLRAGYSRSLGGQYFDDSVRLEPAQIAGFPQAFRSLLPESVGGLVPGTTFDAVNAGYDQRIGSAFHFGVEAGLARSEGDRVVGVLTNSLPLPVPDAASSTRQDLGYVERSLSAYAVASLGDGWTVGLRYRVGEAGYTVEYPGIAPGTPGLERLEEDVQSVLQQAMGSLAYLHRSGVFAEWQTLWFRQETSGYVPDRAGEDFWQHQAWIGYRWPRRWAELRFGVLNITDTGYRLNPLNAVPLPPQGTDGRGQSPVEFLTGR
jgi:tetratricopeptide (TPR) repeat protein